ncbi:DnaB-like helicase C-terminal domain-containing protein [Pediococcus inopinatus]|uniref:DnaB-like helicase C-terminal domain-containing protein n=1 Tax=Pediococcus inopinatus TaxID=114090 RepID=UPI0007C42FA2|nr:DnaB-like helicase C-terminal domain-containing protein [Pediococcus inopinatus]
MNDEIERTIIATLLNKPPDVNLVNINEEWFTNSDYGVIYKAVNELAESNPNLMSIYGKASKGLTNLGFSDLSTIKSEYVTDSNLNSLASNLHKLALNKEMYRNIQEWQNSPFEDNEEKLLETLNKMQNLEEQSDSGEVSEQINELIDSFDHPKPTGIRTYPQVDTFVSGGLYGGMLFTIGARPSVGKTAFSINMVYEATKLDKNLHVDYFTLEMNKREMLNRLISRNTGISSTALRDPANLSPILKKLVLQSTEYIQSRQIRIFDKTKTLDQILSVIRKNAAKAKPNEYLAVVDYIGLVVVPGNQERYVKVGEITRQLKVMANEFNVPIIALSQLNRGIESRQDKTPLLSDLRESGSVEQDSNVVAFLHKPYDSKDVVQLTIAKNREGQLGHVNFAFNGKGMKFIEVE